MSNKKEYENYKGIIIDAQAFLTLMEEKNHTDEAAHTLSKSIISVTTLTEIIYLLITQKGLSEEDAIHIVEHLIKDVEPMDKEDAIQCSLLMIKDAHLSIGDRSSCVALHKKLGCPIFSGDQEFVDNMVSDIVVSPIERLWNTKQAIA